VYATKPHETVAGGATGFTEKTDTFQLTGNFDLGFGTLTSYSQYSKLASHTTNYNLSGSAVSLAPGLNVPFFQINIPIKNNQTITQEFLLNSNSEGRLKWTTGAFFMDWKEPFAAELSIFGAPYFPTGHSGTETISAAAYANAEYRILDNLYLSAGLRYSYDSVEHAFYKDFPGVGSANLPTLNGYRMTPRAVIRYTPDDNSSVYFSFSRGFKSAIYNVGGASTNSVSPESIDAYEAGYKYAHEGLSFDVDSYYYDYTNLQVANFITGPGGALESVVSNAASSRIYGFEGDARYDLTQGLNVNAAVAYTNAKYNKYIGSPSYTQCLDLVACGAQGYGFFGAIPTDLHDTTMMRAPEVTASLGAVYTTGLAGGDLSLSGDLYYTSKIYFDPSNVYKQNGYTLLDLRAEWTDPSGMYTFAVYGHNVTDTNYINQVFANTAGIDAAWGNPATYGAEVKVHFD
jgi:iron complex outermembrane receptor protein